MIPLSIRWRLPLSYARIALLATLVLGVVLLLTLRNYYQQQEQTYLQNNAQAISQEIETFLADDLPVEALQSQLAGFAFLIQARIRLRDSAGNVVVDTGEMAAQNLVATVSVQVEAGNVSQTFSQTVAEADTAVRYQSLIVVQEGNQATMLQTQSQVMGEWVSQLPAVGTLYGFGLGETTANRPRSSQIVIQPVVHLRTGAILGTLELLEGPAYGQAIVQSVAWGWMVSGVVAVGLATAVGWAASRQLTTPLLSLTAVTQQMAAGNLSVRSTIHQPDEFGTLGTAFNTMAGRVEEMVTTLRRFVTDAAHELHTPLTALQTDLELIRAEAHSTIEKNRVTRAQAQVGRLVLLTRNLLDLSQMETETQRHAMLDLTSLIQEVSEIYASQAEQAGVVFGLEVPGQVVMVRGQTQEIRQAITNLLSNAVKFTPAGGEVQLTLQTQARQVVITVQDTGIGIPTEDVPFLFSRFHRGRNATSYPGSGLGLAIVQTAVTAHGGHISITQLPNGTLFRLTLPVMEPHGVV